MTLPSVKTVSSRSRRLAMALRSGRRQLLWYCASLAVLFAVLGIAQHIYIHFQFEQTVAEELKVGASQVTEAIDYTDRWDMEDYRRSSIPVERVYVLAADGLVIDIDGLIPHLFGRAKIIDGVGFDAPTTLVSSIGERWRLLGKKLDAGIAVVGISTSENLSEDGHYLTTNLAKFGTTLAQASETPSKKIDADINFVVLSDAGDITNIWGGVPIYINPRELPVIAGVKPTATVEANKRFYRLLAQPILDSHNRTVGTVIIPKEITLELQALDNQDRFNTAVVALALVSTVAAVLWLIVRELLRRQHNLTITEAIKVGESKTVEYKSTWHWDSKQGKPLDERQFAVLRAIGGFLNTAGGTLCIGVREDNDGRGRVKGLREDLNLYHHNLDELRHSLAQQISQHIGPQNASYITDHIEEVEGEQCWRINVERAPEPVFVNWKGDSKFFIREGPRTNELDTEDALLGCPRFHGHLVKVG